MIVTALLAAGLSLTAAVPDDAVVTRIIDGDTIAVNVGGEVENVRLIGIDTPEIGECGYAEAIEALATLLEGRPIQLTSDPAVVDRDHYDRLLRHLWIPDPNNVGTQADIGLAMIDTGWAIARYDSRDGFGRHLLEDRYVTADEATPDPFPGACDRGQLPPAFDESEAMPPAPEPAPEPAPQDDDNPFDDGGPRNADGSCPPGGCTVPDGPPLENDNPYDDGGARNADGSCPPGGCTVPDGPPLENNNPYDDGGPRNPDGSCPPGGCTG
jgi:endonuclease YncB( thermonuclease family)